MNMNYSERLLQSKNQKEEAEVKYAVEDAKLQLQSDLLSTKKKVSALEKELDDLKSASPLDANKIIKKGFKIPNTILWYIGGMLTGVILSIGTVYAVNKSN